MKRRSRHSAICTLLYLMTGCQVLTTQPAAVVPSPPAATQAAPQTAARSLSKALADKVVAIADGDTITVLDSSDTQHRIRLQGIDAPESRQAFGARSKQHLSDLVFGRQVTVEYNKKDRYGRTPGKVVAGGRDACLEQVRAGMAWHYKYYQNEQSPEDRRAYAAAEVEARAATRGLWADANPTLPWDFRRGRRGGAGVGENGGTTAPPEDGARAAGDERGAADPRAGA